MCMAKGVLGAIAGGVLGAGLWAAVSYVTGYEIGWIAWAVGGLTGAGMAIGNQMRGGRTAGLLAAAVALAAVLGGKLGAAHFYAQKMIDEHAASLTMDDARDYLAMKVEREFEEGGVDVGEPLDEEAAYAPEVIVERDRRWAAMSEDDHQKFMASFKADVTGEGQDAAGALTIVSFVLNFGLFGFLWLGLAVSTAYKFGSGVVKQEESAETQTEGRSDGPVFFRGVSASETPVSPSGASVPQTRAPERAVAQSMIAPGAAPAAQAEGPIARLSKPESDSGAGAGIWARLGQPNETVTRFGDAQGGTMRRAA